MKTSIALSVFFVVIAIVNAVAKNWNDMTWAIGTAMLWALIALKERYVQILEDYVLRLGGDV